MKFQVFYGTKPKLTNANAKDFSHGGYICMSIMETHKGQPVFISKSESGFPAWKVEFGTNCCVFATEKEAMDYCKARFRPLPE